MIHNITFKANWYQVKNRKQDIINKSNQKENKSPIPYEYKVGDLGVTRNTRNSPEMNKFQSVHKLVD
jgi:hypothetical protein